MNHVERCAPNCTFAPKHSKSIAFSKHLRNAIGSVTPRPFSGMQVCTGCRGTIQIERLTCTCLLDIVYAVVYSLLLLNTDLHVAQGNYTRMTRQAFVKNTMSTIRDQQQTDPTWAAKRPNFMLAWEAHIEAYLKDMYISVKNYQILQPMQQSGLDDSGDDNAFLSVSSGSTNSSKRMSIMGGKRMIDIKRSLNTMIHKNGSTRESMLFLDEPSVS